MIDWNNFICDECGYNIFKTKEVTFVNNTKHLEAHCDNCNKRLGYAPSFDIGADSSKYVVYLPKYKGKTLEEIYQIDPGYVQWMAMNLKGKPGFMAKDFLNRIDTGKGLN